MEKKSTTNFSVPKGTTHLMMWFGGALPTKQQIDGEHSFKYTYPSSNSGEDICVDYVKTLQGECKKMAEKNEACILVYSSKMLENKNEEKKQLKDVVKDIPNCYLVDYDDYIKNIADIPLKQEVAFKFDVGTINKKSKYTKISDFKEHINKLIEYHFANPEKNADQVERNSLGNIVDCARLLLLLQPKVLKNLAIQTNNNKKTFLPNSNDSTLLYHDFDIIQNNVLQKDNIGAKKFPENIELCCCKPQDNADSTKFENGIIFANSQNDRNEIIENIIHMYMNQMSEYTPLSDPKAIFPCMQDEKRVVINDFSNQFIDEGHRTWKKNRKTKNNDITFSKDEVNKNKMNKKGSTGI